MADNHTFISLEQGWQTYLEAYGHALKPEDLEDHRRSFMVGAISYDSIVFRMVEQLGPDAAKQFLMGIHEETQAYVREQQGKMLDKAEALLGHIVKRN